jgi:polyhydroxyalkanoate synthesis regulator phasin
MQDAWRAYLELALGLTEVSKKKAQAVVRKLVGQTGATAAQLQAHVDELMSSGLANRETLIKIVRFEVDRALGAVGLATADEVAQLTARVRQLERELRTARERPPAAEPAAPGSFAAEARTSAPEAPAAPMAKAVAKKAPVAKKAVARRAETAMVRRAEAGGEEAGAPPETLRETPSGQLAPATRKTVARKLASAAKKAPARKLPPAAKKAVAKKLPPAAGGSVA